jgi:3-phenylpropionate/trans-cinnamate dioxygenase ferredoxin subunit
MARFRIAALADLPVGGGTALEVAGRSLLICRSGAGTFVIENRCSHQLAKLEGGKIKGAHIFCPLHGVRFDMRDGSPTGTLTKTPITVFESSIEDDVLFVEMNE